MVKRSVEVGLVSRDKLWRGDRQTDVDGGDTSSQFSARSGGGGGGGGSVGLPTIDGAVHDRLLGPSQPRSGATAAGQPSASAPSGRTRPSPERAVRLWHDGRHVLLQQRLGG